MRGSRHTKWRSTQHIQKVTEESLARHFFGLLILFHRALSIQAFVARMKLDTHAPCANRYPLLTLGSFVTTSESKTLARCSDDEHCYCRPSTSDHCCRTSNDALTSCAVDSYLELSTRFYLGRVAEFVVIRVERGRYKILRHSRRWSMVTVVPSHSDMILQ